MEKQTIYEKLQRLIPKEHIKQDEPLNQYTFTKTGGKADFLVLLRMKKYRVVFCSPVRILSH